MPAHVPVSTGFAYYSQGLQPDDDVTMQAPTGHSIVSAYAERDVPGFGVCTLHDDSAVRMQRLSGEEVRFVHLGATQDPITAVIVVVGS